MIRCNLVLFRAGPPPRVAALGVHHRRRAYPIHQSRRCQYPLHKKSFSLMTNSEDGICRAAGAGRNLLTKRTPAISLGKQGSRAAAAPPTPPGSKESNGNGCCRVSGFLKAQGRQALRLPGPCGAADARHSRTPRFAAGRRRCACGSIPKPGYSHSRQRWNTPCQFPMPDAVF